MKTKVLFSTPLFLIFSLTFSQIIDSGGGEYKQLQTECISDHDRAKIFGKIIQNRHLLESQGLINTSTNNTRDTQNHPLFEWPVIKNPSAPYNNCWSISNHVDHNPSFPNQLLDYNCGNRTYDTANGYNHKGIDIFTWPFSWYQFQNNHGWVVAAASGIIIGKQDGNFDMSCNFNNNNWNAVYIQHNDGSVAWYGHLKSGSLTSKNVGQSVVVGEYLGVIGSSGNSTGPHLHFEVYNSNNQLVDPYIGSCNNLPTGTNSWWSNQKPYDDPKINAVFTHCQPPQFNTCPQTEITNFCNFFPSGNNVHIAVYLADQRVGHNINYVLTRPNGTVAATNNVISNNNFNASYWWWNLNSSLFNMNGQWTITFNFQGQSVSHQFDYGQLNVETFNEEKFTVYPNPVNQYFNVKSNEVIDKIVIYDIIGKKLYETKSSTNIDISFMPKGIYQLKIYSDNNIYFSKILKN